MNTESRRTGILRLRHLLEVTEAKGEELAEAAPRFKALADKSAAPRVVTAFQLFQTPPELTARIAGMFPTGFGRTLEPSAGLGRLYRAVRAIDAACPVVLVEQSPACAGELYRATEGDGAASLHVADFLTMDAGRLGLFDSILMNPPFHRGADVRHVLHAVKLLAPGGRLVSVVAAGPRQRVALLPLASEWIDLPAGSFRSEGTGVETALVVIDKESRP